MVKASDLYLNWNYAATDSDEYKHILGQIDALLGNGKAADPGEAEGGRNDEARMTNDESMTNNE